MGTPSKRIKLSLNGLGGRAESVSAPPSSPLRSSQRTASQRDRTTSQRTTASPALRTIETRGSEKDKRIKSEKTNETMGDIATSPAPAALGRPSSRSIHRMSNNSIPSLNSFTPVNGAGEQQPRKKTFMDRWVEPPLPTPQPSYKDYPGLGLQPYGVLESMAPLGVPPPTKMKKMVREREMRRSRAAGEESSDMGTPMPALGMDGVGDTTEAEVEESDVRDEIAQAEREVAERELRRRELKRGREVEEEDYVPGKKKSASQVTGRRQSSKRSAAIPKEAAIMESVEPEAGSARRRESSRVLTPKKAAKKATATPTPARSSRIASNRPTSPYKSTAQPQPTANELALTDRAVQFAVEDAIHDRRWPTAYALRTLYNDTKINPRTPHLFMRIYTETATAAEIDEFQSLISWKKKEGRQDGTAKRYFEKFDNVYDGEGWRKSGWDKEGDSAQKSKESSALTKACKSPSKSRDVRLVSGGDNSRGVRAESTGGVPGAESARPPTTLTAPTATATAIPPHASSTNDPRKNARTLNASSLLHNNNVGIYQSPYATRRSVSPARKSLLTDNNNFANNYQSNIPQNHKVNDGSRNGLHGVDAQQHHVTRLAANASIEKNSTDHDGDITMAGSGVQQGDAAPSGSGRKRSLSTSSTSSLSSVDETIFKSPEKKKSYDFEAPPSSPAKKLTGAAAHKPKKAAGAAAHKRFADKKDADVQSSSADTTPAPGSKLAKQLHERAAASESGEFDVYAPTFGVPGRRGQKKNEVGIKFSEYSGPRELDFQLAKNKVKREAEEHYKQAINQPSFERTAVAMPEPQQKPKPVLRFKQYVPQGQPAAEQRFNPTPRSSPIKLNFRPENQLGDRSSRAVTPIDGEKGGRPKRDGKNKGARMKTSPQKKKNNRLTFHDISKSTVLKGANAARSSPIIADQDDNDDFCASCHGGGDLICCDGCTRSFHLKCLDPPMAEDQLPDEWYCTVCMNEHRGPPPFVMGKAANKPYKPGSLWAPLFELIEKKNPVSFHLPKDVREYFEGVTTGPHGEYVESAPGVKRGKNDLEGIDLLRLKDKDGSPVLCHACGKGTDGKRMIITCAFCRLHWHLDCLDPPLAIPPVNSTLRPWRCPVHLDDLISKVQKRKFRKIKNQPSMVVLKARGFKNKGNIEVELDEDEKEDDGFIDETEFGRTYTLPEQGIKLDFMTKANESREREERRRQDSVLSSTNIASSPPPHLPAHLQARPPMRPSAVTMHRYTLDEQQVALNMQALGSAGGVPDDVVQTLIDELIANADKNVIKMMAKSTVDTFGIGKSGNKAITMQEMQGVKMLREIIEKLDERVNGKSAEKAGDGAVAADGGTASAEGAKAVGDGDGDGDGDAEMADADAEKPAADADGVPDPDGKKRKRSDTTGTSDEQHEKKASKTGEEKGAGGSSDAKMLV